MDDEKTIVGVRITIPTGGYTRETDVYCHGCASSLHLWEEYPIYVHTARQYHLSCCVCHTSLIEKYCLSKLAEYETLVVRAFMLLDNNPLGTVHDVSRLRAWHDQEAQWKRDAHALLFLSK